MFKNLKVGDKVWVQPQEGRYGGSKKGEYIAVAKIGRKYGYLAKEYGDRAFCLKTGRSHHPSFENARANGYGFDVYPTSQGYLDSLRAQQEWVRLKSRLITSHFKMIDLPPEAVAAIHKILDEHGVGSCP